jgi:hypothetical protein
MALSGGGGSKSKGGSAGTTAGRGGIGGTGAGGLRLSPAEEAEVGTAASTGASTAEKATAIKAARQAGKLPSTEQKDTDIQNKALVDSMVAQRTSSAKDAEHALAEVVDELNASGHGDITDSLVNLEKAETAAGSGGGSSSSWRESSSWRAGATQVKKRPDLGPLPEAPVVAPPATASADEINAAIQMQIDALKDPNAPTLSLPDYITRVRDINAGRFGPTNAYPSYRQRNVMQGIYNMAPEDQQTLISQYRAHQASQPTAPVAARTAAPEPVRAPMDMTEPAPTAPVPVLSPTMPPPTAQENANRRAELEALIGKRAEDRALIDSMLTPAPTAALVAPRVQAPVPRPVYDMTQTAAPVPSMATRLAGPVPVPPSIGTKTEGILPESTRTPRDVTEAPALRPSFAGTPEAALLQRQNQTPGMITGGTNLVIDKAQRAAAETKAAADVKAARGAGINKGATTAETQWMDQRMTAALTLAKQPDRLSRVAASKVGKEAVAYYTADKATGFSVIHTVDALKKAYAADPEARDRAVEIVIATAVANHDAVNP